MIFIDTSFIISYKLENDENHAKALEIISKIKEINDVTVISDYIFDEALTVALSKTKNVEFAAEIGEELKKIQIIKINDQMFDAAFTIFKNQKETKFSFTDCTTIALMEIMNIKYIATFDSDFTKIKEINVV